MSDYTRSEWCIALLNSMGNSTVSGVILNFLIAWTKLESSPPGAMYNLLNTERAMPGATNFNSAGVKNYLSFEQGIEANRLAISNGLYPNIFHLFSYNDASVLSNALSGVLSELNTWCGGCNYGAELMIMLTSGNIGASDIFPGDQPMSNIEILPVTEFSPGKTEFACGSFAVGICAWATKPGQNPANNPTALAAWAYAEYAKVNGNDSASNTNGSSIANMRTYLEDTASGTPNHLHYWEMDTISLANIKTALSRGYPVIVTITEASVYDLDLQANPYWWGATGSHVLVIVEVDTSGDFLVFDSAAVEQGDGNLQTPKTPLPWPRRYRASTLSFTGYATPIQMPWLPAIPSGDPSSWPPLQPPAPPAPSATAIIIWQAVLGSAVRHNTGIFEMWYGDYQRGNFRGPALTQELPFVDPVGKNGVFQVFPGGQYVWIDGIGSFNQFT